MRIVKILLVLLVFLGLTSRGNAQIYFFNVYSSGSFDSGEGVCQLPDSSYLVTGGSGGFSNSSQAFVMKVSKTGQQIWTKSFGGNEDETGRRIFFIKDTIYVFGRTNSYGSSYDYYFLKLDSTGNLIAEKSIGTANYDWLQDAVFVARDSTFALYGYTQDNDDFNKYRVVSKIDRNGNELWKSSVMMNPNAKLTMMHSYNDSTFVILGNEYDSTRQHFDGLLKIYRFDGTLIDSLIYFNPTDTSLNKDICFNDFVISNTENTRFLLIGDAARIDNGEPFSDLRIWTYFTDTKINIQENNGLSDQYLLSIAVMAQKKLNPSESVAITRAKRANFGVIGDGFWDEQYYTYSSDYTLYWTGNITNVSAFGDDITNQIIPTSDGGVISVGYNQHGGDNIQNVTLLKIGPNNESVPPYSIPSPESLLKTKAEEQFSFSIYPNPTNGILNINADAFDKVEVFDLSGNKLLESQQKEIDLTNLNTGMYLVCVEANGYKSIQKIIKE